MATDYILASSGFDVEISGSSSSPQALRSNPLSSRVATVLSANYADADLRDALELLDSRGIENSSETRRQLRLRAQKDIIDCNGDVIREFGHVAEQLKRIGLTIASLNQGCEEMKRHITAAHQETAPILEETSELMKQRETVETKRQLLTAFNRHFIMPEDEVTTLTSTAQPVDEKFFINLTRAKKIQNDCEVLLGTENQRLGHEIMEQTTKILNGAFQKLYRWIQREFKSLNLENPQISSSIRRALRVLAERPSLFQNCLDFFAEAREHILSDAFYTALTGTSVSGEEDTSVKPIELAAHDPLRYVGDMLAWTHSATVSEREALEVLFISDGDEIAKGIQAGRENEPWSRITKDEDNADDFDGLKALNDLVDRDVGGVARVLRQRIGQVIQSHEETILAYKTANLLNFYRVTFTKLLGADSVLLDSLTSLEESALRQFKVLMRDHVASVHSETQIPPANLGPPEFLQDGLKQLTAIMKTYETSFSSPNSRETDFEPVLVEALDPFLKGSDDLGTELDAPKKTIYTINCLLATKSTLTPFPFATNRLSDIQASIEKNGSDLVDYQYFYFRESSALQPIIEALAPLSDKPEDIQSIRSLGPFQSEALIQASQTLDDFLPSALMDAMDNLKLLQSPKLAREVTEQAAEKFSEDFEQVEGKLIAADEIWEQNHPNVEGREQLLREIFPRTSGEVRVLLS